LLGSLGEWGIRPATAAFHRDYQQNAERNAIANVWKHFAVCFVICVNCVRG
jgi:hypothetical protein